MRKKDIYFSYRKKSLTDKDDNTSILEAAPQASITPSQEYPIAPAESKEQTVAPSPLKNSGGRGYTPRTSRRIKIVGCRECDNCLKPNCRVCESCVDKKIYGGLGKINKR